MTDDVLVAFRSQLHVAAVALAQDHARRRRKRLALAATLMVLLVAATSALAATGVLAGWVGGETAPVEVQEDFAAIRPELGYKPEASEAVAVARDTIRASAPGTSSDGTSAGDVVLYATPTRQGGYCLVARTPWLPTFDGDGRGYCIGPGPAKRPLVAGIIGSAGDPAGSFQETSIVAGRVQVAGATTIRLATPSGDQVERRLGAGGFFVAAVSASIQTCFGGNLWAPTLSVDDASGRVLVQARFPLWVPGTDRHGDPLGTCGIGGLMSDAQAAGILNWQEGPRWLIPRG